METENAQSRVTFVASHLASFSGRRLAHLPESERTYWETISAAFLNDLESSDYPEEGVIMGLDDTRSQVWLHMAQVHRMQREKVCGPVLDEQLRVLAGALDEHLDAVRVGQLNGYLYGEDAE